MGHSKKPGDSLVPDVSEVHFVPECELGDQLGVESDGTSRAFDPSSREPYISNRSGYPHVGSENFEHDDTGAEHNLSGVEDDIVNAEAEHNGWTAAA